MQDWWNTSLKGINKKAKQKVVSLLIYTSWNIWKERNRRIFEGTAARPSRVLVVIKEEMKLRDLACGQAETSSVINA
jgi:hypothetical protein